LRTSWPRAGAAASIYPFRKVCPGSTCENRLDAALARRYAEVLKIRLTGTLGVLLDAKHRGLVSSVTPLIDDLQRLGLRWSEQMRRAVLRRAEEP
jgi:predicted nucleic acid-binding protein